MLLLAIAPVHAQDDDCIRCIVLPGDPGPGGPGGGDCDSQAKYYDVTADLTVNSQRTATTFYDVALRPLEELADDTFGDIEGRVADKASEEDAPFFGEPERTEFWLGGEREIYSPAYGRRLRVEFQPTSSGTVRVQANLYEGHLYLFFRKMIAFNYAKLWIDGMVANIVFNGEYNLITNSFVSSSVSVPGLDVEADAEYIAFPFVYISGVPSRLEDYIESMVRESFEGADVDITGDFVETVTDSPPLLDLLATAGVTAQNLVREDDLVKLTIDLTETDCDINGKLVFKLEVDRQQALLLARQQTSTEAAATGATAAHSAAPSGLRVYPNPVTDQVTFEVATEGGEDVDVTVYDVSGREVFASTSPATGLGVQRLSFDLSHLPSGVYVGRVVTPSGQSTHQISVVR